MSDTIFLGQYWARDSIVHAMDPRTKLIGSFAAMIFIFCAQNFIALGICALFVVGFFRAADIPFKKALASIGPFLFIVAITALLNVFFVQGGDAYLDWGWLRISQGGVVSALFLSARLVELLLCASLLTLTTPMLDITDALEGVLSPLKRIGFPAHEFAMIMGIALRFLPRFATEARGIYRAQISRGASFSKNPFKGGISSLTSLMVPLFTSAFRHAETLSAAMDARCYHGGEGRTHLHPLHLTSADRTAVQALGAMVACVIAADICVALFF